MREELARLKLNKERRELRERQAQREGHSATPKSRQESRVEHRNQPQEKQQPTENALIAGKQGIYVKIFILYFLDVVLAYALL